MHITVLGGIQVRHRGGTEVRLPPLQRAALLTLIELGRRVSIDELRTLLWDEPDVSNGRVSTMISKLAAAVDRRVISDRGFYRFEGHDDYVDLVAFRAVVDRANALSVHEPQTAVLLYERALALWTTPAFVGMPSTTAMDTLLKRLIDERLNLVERLAEVRLALGLHREVAISLPAEVDAAPHREHLRGLLMLALYRAQRLSEARALYEATGQVLNAPPGPALRLLEQQIAAGDPALNIEPVSLPASDKAVIASGGDLSRAYTARMMNYLLGGAYNTTSDRAGVEFLKAVGIQPDLVQRASEEAAARVVRTLAKDLGVRQIVELGAMVPWQYSPHEVARLPRPGARAVYANTDPAIVSHSKALLSDVEGVACISASLRNPRSLLDHPEFLSLINIKEPVLFLDRTEVNKIPDEDDPGALFAELVDAMAPGSYLMLVGPTAEGMSHLVESQIAELFRDIPELLIMRSPAQFASLCSGLEILPPGVTECGAFWTTRPAKSPSFRALAVVGLKH